MAPHAWAWLGLGALLLATPLAAAQDAAPGPGLTFFSKLAEGSGDTLFQANTSSNFVLATKFKPCTGFQVHTHPRGSELVMAHTGELTVGYVDEAGKVVSAELTPTNGVFLVPQGLIHWVVNRGCAEASASFVFPPNPGLQFVMAATAAIPASTLAYFTDSRAPVQKGALYSTPEPGCAARCGAASAAGGGAKAPPAKASG
ncbi:germin-like protein [Scenedesmus sp. PABB004]|nr:germin-like protein [Scenedesmus sp. PABB004]